jgi:polyhydroxyalkanoate synthesis regulator phasin
VAAESGTIRIGTTSTQSKTYIAGIYGTSVTGSAVVVSSTGQLGVTVSSERFKTDIAPMSSASEKLQQLRPVTFHLKSDPHGPLQYGLIAEEVAKVYPELVIRDESGRIDGVRYDELAPMLVNEAQQQKKQRVAQAIKNAGQDARIAAQDAEIRTLRRQVAELQDLKQELRAALAKPNATDKLVADR